jgi:hypothetical protein
MTSEASDYVLSNTAEAERLRVQARAWEPDVELLLDQIGVRPGWRCLDMGCGAIGILEPLSRRVGPRGRSSGSIVTNASWRRRAPTLPSKGWRMAI